MMFVFVLCVYSRKHHFNPPDPFRGFDTDSIVI